MVQITPIPLPICNAYLVKDEKTILVDTGRPADFQSIVKALEKQHVGQGDVSLILHTHGHWDHCGSSQQLREWTGAPLAVHRGDADMMRSGKCELRPVTWGGWVLKQFLNGECFAGAGADMVLEGETDLSSFGVQARVLHTPGHTMGSISLVSGDEAIVGDLVLGGFLGGWVWPGFPNYHYFADDLDLLRNSLRRLLDLGVRSIFPGHGGRLEAERIRQRFFRDLEMTPVARTL